MTKTPKEWALALDNVAYAHEKGEKGWRERERDFIKIVDAIVTDARIGYVPADQLLKVTAALNEAVNSGASWNGISRARAALGEAGGTL